MSRRFDCAEPVERAKGIAEAISALRRGELVVLPTDTVYGVGCDAFTPAAVTTLLDAKGRGREMPPPVLVGSVRAATALVEDLGTYGQDLIDEFWPGALTIVCRANRNLAWDLGETKGTVAVRMPLHEVALELLKEAGPLAVSSANLSGEPAARTAEEAEERLGDAVSVYLDAGPAGQGEASTIIDLTGPVPRLLRAGAVSEQKLRSVVGVILTDDDDEEDDDLDATPPTLRKEDDAAPEPRGEDAAAPTLRKEDAPAPTLRKEDAAALTPREGDDAAPESRGEDAAAPALRKEDEGG
ncbi:threonylcarbamoyl-AMP synthase [Actinomadura craniellae]|uniref:L-threonylcarbamoyladenylate synthase n=1 Tax=Actinomadura craniellae TaxID=2231787 RepID=A0A365HAF6_9ACTN|nr:L-threonylcarbamoyladenylate synthase [Actinomadura craniellae]RAY16009.1 threonylcarbamoyl-AMP synthase [Actinomadura craniellae]